MPSVHSDTGRDGDLATCIANCLACYQACHGGAMTHCLETGGAHVEPAHFRLMTACAEICRASAHIMLSGYADHHHVCRACAEICEACAQDCQRVGGMEACVDSCRRCAQSCRAMADMAH